MKNGTDIALRISVYVDLGHIWGGQTANLDFSSAQSMEVPLLDHVYCGIGH